MKKTALSLIFSLAAFCVYPQAATIKANGITLFYESFGKVDNQPVILISSAGESLISWPFELCERVADEGFRVIRFDNRDMGLSSRLDTLGAPDWAAIGPFIRTCDPAPLPYTLKDMAADVIGLMDGLNLEKAHLVGSSMGGAIAQLVAVHHPTRVLSLTTIAASSGDPTLPEPTPLARNAVSTPPPSATDKDALVRYMVSNYRALGSIDDDATLRSRASTEIERSWYPEGRARQVAAITVADNCDRRKDLEKIQVPTTVIHGDVDPLVSPEAANQIAGAITGSQLFIINGMGHDLSGRFIVPISELIVRTAKRAAASQTLK